MPLTLKAGVALERRFVTLAEPLSPQDRASVREHVVAFVREAKEARSWLPEHVVIGLKHIAAQCGIRPEPTGAGVLRDPSETETLYSDVIAWAIEAYYSMDR